MIAMRSRIPSDIDVSAHDRYLVYQMLNRNVSFALPNNRKPCSGVVEQVLRNIFSNQVELTVKGQLFCFDEPVAIVRVNGSEHGSVVFVYGDIGPEPGDDDFFGQLRDDSEFYGENVDDILTRTRPKDVRVVEFLMGPPIRRRRTWRMPEAVPA